MPRRKKSDAEAMLELFARFPWWLCLALAAGSYLLLHHFAGREPPAPSGLDEMSGVIVQTIGITFAKFGQYVLPVLLTAAAPVAFFRRRKRRALADGFVSSGGNVGHIDPFDFEQLVGELYRRKGYRVTETAKGPDGGIDLVLRRASDTYLVQCKHWKGRPVGVTVVRELNGVIAAQGAAGGAVVASGGFTGEAVAFARKAGVDLVDGETLRSLPIAERIEPVMSEPGLQADPLCPSCGSQMALRQARRGANAGNKFWGCSSYPRCRGTVPI